MPCIAGQSGLEAGEQTLIGQLQTLIIHIRQKNNGGREDGEREEREGMKNGKGRGWL